jgi:hypothetical protein
MANAAGTLVSAAGRFPTGDMTAVSALTLMTWPGVKTITSFCATSSVNTFCIGEVPGTALAIGADAGCPHTPAKRSSDGVAAAGSTT